MRTTPASATELVIQIKAEMARQGVTLPQLAEQLGAPYSTLRDRLASPDALRYRDLLSITNALDVPLSTLAARAESQASQKERAA